MPITESERAAMGIRCTEMPRQPLMLETLRAGDALGPSWQSSLRARRGRIADVSALIDGEVRCVDWQRAAWQLGLTLMCLGYVTVRVGIPNTTLADDESQVVTEMASW
jgi:hypothetical protein